MRPIWPLANSNRGPTDWETEKERAYISSKRAACLWSAMTSLAVPLGRRSGGLGPRIHRALGPGGKGGARDPANGTFNGTLVHLRTRHMGKSIGARSVRVAICVGTLA